MKINEVAETPTTTVRVLHGSPYPDIREFRFHDLRNRTGTPGTLSFTESQETAAIYGRFIYTCDVTGRFGDFQNPQDAEKVFQYRWPEHWGWISSRAWTPEQITGQKTTTARDIAARQAAEQAAPDYEEKIAQKLHAEIARGDYALWENVSVWKACGWDGAWCFESGSRNLIVGSAARIEVIGRS
jgi:hypothetical protein